VDNVLSSPQISSSSKELLKDQAFGALGNGAINSSANVGLGNGSAGATSSTTAKGDGHSAIDQDLAVRLDKHSLEAIVELKISRFLDQIGTFYPEDLHSLIIKKVEKPLLGQILRRTGGNQVHASKILGINRNTLRKKMKLYGF
jgi:DNA-binding protein Fis